MCGRGVGGVAGMQQGDHGVDLSYGLEDFAERQVPPHLDDNDDDDDEGGLIEGVGVRGCVMRGMRQVPPHLDDDDDVCAIEGVGVRGCWCERVCYEGKGCVMRGCVMM